MEKAKASIGIFDSGMGGLTVLKAIRQRLPHESYIYLGDTARLPYGTKSPHTVKQYAIQMAKQLVERDIKALVIACNTATTAALPYLQSMLPELPVIGVVQPGAEAAIAATQKNCVGVLATETTIASNAYQSLIEAAIPGVVIKTQGCSLLVALAEEGMVDDDIAKATLRHYLTGFEQEDTLLLGCTHFPVFKPLLKRILPEAVTVVDSADSTARALQDLLTQKDLLNKSEAIPNSTRYLVTDSIERFKRVGEIFLGHSLEGHAIELVDGVA